MRPRFPSGDGFAISVGVLVASATYVSLSTFVSAVAPDHVPGAAVLVGLLAWGAVEQVPDAADEFVRSRGYLALGALAVLPFLVVPVGRLAGRSERVEPFVLPTLAVAVVGFLVVGTGSSRRARQFLATETERLELAGTVSRRYRLAETVFGVSLGVVLVHVVSGETVTPSSFVGSAVSGLIVFAASSTRTFDVTVVDSGLVVGRGEATGRALVPWRRIHAIDVDGDTVLVRRGFPRFTTYAFDRSSADDAREVADVLRRCRRR